MRPFTAGRILWMTALSLSSWPIACRTPLISEIRRHRSKDPEGQNNTESKFLVYFRVDEVLPLTSGGA
jgi:hypothetical protein